VLAIAVMGIVMVNAFGYRLNRTLVSLPISAAEVHEIQSQEVRLAGLQPPASIDGATRAAFRKAVAEAFVFGFRLFMFICAALALAGAAISWLMICKTPAPSHSGLVSNQIGAGAEVSAGG
jgi:hypothetical protein